MKLIIDIPNDTYKKIIADKYAIYDRMYYSIKNGIPFDKIRAEIVELQKEYQEYGWAYDDALEIIDKYRNEVSE